MFKDLRTVTASPPMRTIEMIAMIRYPRVWKNLLLPTLGYFLPLISNSVSKSAITGSLGF
jgi:hypothetical protein